MRNRPCKTAFRVSGYRCVRSDAAAAAAAAAAAVRLNCMSAFC